METCDGNCGGPPPQDAQLVTNEILDEVVSSDVGNDFESADGVLPTERILSVFIHGQILKLLGRLSLCGADPNTTRAVAADIHHIVSVAVISVQIAYRNLLSDLMPDWQPGESSPDKNKGDEETGPAGEPAVGDGPPF